MNRPPLETWHTTVSQLRTTAHHYRTMYYAECEAHSATADRITRRMIGLATAVFGIGAALGAIVGLILTRYYC